MGGSLRSAPLNIVRPKAMKSIPQGQYFSVNTRLSLVRQRRVHPTCIEIYYQLRVIPSFIRNMFGILVGTPATSNPLTPLLAGAALKKVRQNQTGELQGVQGFYTTATGQRHFAKPLGSDNYKNARAKSSAEITPVMNRPSTPGATHDSGVTPGVV